MGKNKIVTLGTRGSNLALIQTNIVEDLLKKHSPGTEIRRIIVKTRGDIIHDRPISKVGEKGVFTKELEHSLLQGESDIAVHSLKDMPATISAGLSLPGVLAREDSRDALISTKGLGFFSLPEGSIVGTSSLRRGAILKNHRPALIVKELRGNVDTRLKKLDSGQYDAIILAAAGLIRSGYSDRIVEYLDSEVFVPSGCQGIIGLEVREMDEENTRRVQEICHSETLIMAECERSFMRTLEGGCSTPMGCLCRITGDTVVFTGMVADPEGTKLIQKTARGSKDAAAEIGISLAREIIKAGGKEILDAIEK
jgi:hydroxymethylbilane synthase